MAVLEKYLAELLKLNTHMLCNLAISLLGIIPTKLNGFVH